MSKRIVDENMPIGKLTAIKNFLPPPSQLVFPPPTVKVTLHLSEPSIKFFKRQAAKHHTKYQRMIRSLVDLYVRQQTG